MATFKDWVRAESLDSHCTIDQFQGAAIAIDGDEYLDTLLTKNLTREPLLPALGGLPFALEKHVDDDLKNFAAYDITPIFAFNGLQVASKDKAIVMREARKAAKDLDEAWSIYDQGRGEEAVNAFGKACEYLCKLCGNRVMSNRAQATTRLRTSSGGYRYTSTVVASRSR